VLHFPQRVCAFFFFTSIVYLQQAGECFINDFLHSFSCLYILLFSLAKLAFGPTRVFDIPRSERVITSNTPVVTEQGPYDVHEGMSPMAGGGARGGPDQTVVGGGSDGTTTTTDLGGHRGGGGGRNSGFFSRAVDNVVSVTQFPFCGA
jgi:hypothetical protein